MRKKWTLGAKKRLFAMVGLGKTSIEIAKAFNMTVPAINSARLRYKKDIYTVEVFGYQVAADILGFTEPKMRYLLKKGIIGYELNGGAKLIYSTHIITFLTTRKYGMIWDWRTFKHREFAKIGMAQRAKGVWIPVEDIAAVTGIYWRTVKKWMVANIPQHDITFYRKYWIWEPTLRRMYAPYKEATHTL